MTSDWVAAACAAAGRPAAAAPTALITPSGAQLAFVADVVIKRHAGRTDLGRLRRRMAHAAANPAFVPPVSSEVLVLDDRAVTVWPRVPVAGAEDDPLPWAAAGTLLARLHRCPADPGLPSHGWPVRMVRAAARAPSELAALGRALAAAAGRDEPSAVLHGDWHLGQLGRWTDGWRLLDVDDLGVGDPTWDLARPAGFWAAGLLDPNDWRALLGAYRGAAGPAAPPAGDWWPALDLPARCAVFVAAVRAVAKARTTGDPHSDSTAQALVAACRRMAL